VERFVGGKRKEIYGGVAVSGKRLNSQKGRAMKAVLLKGAESPSESAIGKDLHRLLIGGMVNWKATFFQGSRFRRKGSSDGKSETVPGKVD